MNKRDAWLWLALVGLLILLGIMFLTGCQESFHRTKTKWIDQRTPYPTTILELIDGSAEAGESIRRDMGAGYTPHFDMGAALAGDVTATNVRISRTLPDGTVAMLIEAETLTISRSDPITAVTPIVESMTDRVIETIGVPLQTISDKIDILISPMTP